MVEHRDTLSTHLANYAVKLPSQVVPQSALDAARDALVDTVACGLRGASLPPAQAVKRAIHMPEVPGRYLCFDGTQTQTPAQAAFINATAAHSLELDDTDATGLCHPGVVVIPAVLATASDLDSLPGHSLLEAVVVGYDVALRLARWINPAHRTRGFHTTATITALGAVAAVSRLRGVTAEQCASAMGVALSYAGGSFEFVTAGSNLKRVHAGKAASTAIQSCDLAAAGIEGPATALEGPYGFYVTSVGDQQKPLDLDGLGNTFLIEQVGTKRHPCCRFCHTAIDAAIDLHRQGLPVDEITSIDVMVSSLCHTQTGNTAPRNELQRQFSTPYGVALGLLTGGTTLSDYQDAPNIEALLVAEGVRVVTNPACEPRDRRATVRVTTTDRRYERTLTGPRGEPSAPLTRQERLDKFHSLVQGLALPISARALHGRLSQVQSLSDTRDLLDLLQSALPPTPHTT